jgi:hypothetical protein
VNKTGPAGIPPPEASGADPHCEHAESTSDSKEIFVIDPVRRARAALFAAVALTLLFPLALAAQNTPSSQPQTPPADAPITFTETVIVTTPLPAVELPARRVPAPVQTATDRDIDNSGALDLSDFLNRRLNGVHVNEVQNNPFQPDVNYRG